MAKRFELHIKYESELDHNFARQIASFPGGETLSDCLQCGTCSAACPLSIYMDYTPRKIIAMLRSGFKDEVVHSKTIWLCSSCYACSVECPKKVKLTEIMYAIKRQAIKENIWPKAFRMTPTMNKEFFRLVEKNGRNSEGRLMMNIYRKTMDINSILKMTPVGIHLLAKRRIRFGIEKISNIKELKKILDAVGSGNRSGVNKGKGKEEGKMEKVERNK